LSRVFWLESRATIVLLPPGEEGKELFSLAQNWAEVGLLGPALWVSPESVEFPKNEPVVVPALVMGTDREGEQRLIQVDLFEQLARENLSIIRMVKVRSMSPRQDFDEAQNQIAKAVENALTAVMPSRDLRDSLNVHTTLQVTNLIAAPSAHIVEQRLKWELSSGNITVVASPEDRSSPWATDAYIRSGDRFVGFVLMHLATVGGLWNGLPVGTLELFEREESGGEQVWLSRVFVSSVLTDGLARRVAAQVLLDAVDDETILDTPPAGCAYIEDDVRDDYINSMVNYMMTLDEAVLSYRRPPLLEDPEKVDMSIPAQIADFFRFSGNKILRIPYWAFRFVRGTVGGFLEGKLQGADGLAQVEGDLRRDALDYHDRTLMDRESELADMEREARKAASAPIRLSEIRSTPSLWASIREMVFSALDGGSDLSNKGFPLVNTRTKPIFRSVSHLFPNPVGNYSLPADISLPEGASLEIGWENYGDAMGLSRHLDSWQREAALETDRHNSQLADYSTEVSRAKKRLAKICELLDANEAMTTNSKGDSVPITIEEARSRTKAANVTTDIDSPYGPSATDSDTGNAADSEESNRDAEPGDSLESGSESSRVQTNEELVAELSDEEKLPESIEPVVNLEDWIREHKTLTKRIKELGQLIAEAEEASRRSQDEEAVRGNVAKEFGKWQVSSERSLLWKLRAQLTNSMKTAESDLAAFTAALEEIEPNEPGTLTQLRKAFHKRLLITHSVIWLVAGIVSAIGWGLYSVGGSGQENAQSQIGQSQQILEPSGVTVAAPTLETLDLYLTDAREVQGTLTQARDTAEAALAANPENVDLESAFLDSDALANEADLYVNALEALQASFQSQELGRQILLWLAVLTPAALLLSLLILLIPYYRKWSVFRRHVDIQLTNLERIQKGNQVSRSEIERMKALHAQAIDWLKILALSAHTPWEVRPSWLESGLKTLQLDSLPFAMRVAQAHDGDHGSFSTLIDSANEKLAQPGWRQRAFERLVDEIARGTGKSRKAFSLETLDRDLPHATNNSRSHLLKHMRHSDYLQRVAVQYLKPLIEELQGKAMATARPEVFQVEHDALEELKGDIEGIDEYRKFESWDNFLSYTLTLGNGKPDPVTALSVMAIASEKVMEGEHEQVNSYALLPEHVHQKLDQDHVLGVTMNPYDSKTARPLDSVIRVDLVGPVSFDGLRLFSGASVEEETTEPEQKPRVPRQRPTF